MKNTSTKSKWNTTDCVYENKHWTRKDLIVTSCSIIIPSTHMLGGILSSFQFTPEKQIVKMLPTNDECQCSVSYQTVLSYCAHNFLFTNQIIWLIMTKRGQVQNTTFQSPDSSCVLVLKSDMTALVTISFHTN